MPKRRWLILFTALGVALVYSASRRGGLKQISASQRVFSMPGAGVYDVFSGLLLGRLYALVADQVAAACPAGMVVDAGCGPGHLAIRLAQIAPALTVIGVDISPDMIERAARRAMQARVTDRVQFKVGDVGALAFPDEQVDFVVSSLSLHHWLDPVRGLSEIHRVLKPGSRAYIYDLPSWLMRLERRDTDLTVFAAASPFGRGKVEAIPWPRPVSLVRRLELRRVDTSLEKRGGAF